MQAFGIAEVKDGLVAAGGGYEIAHRSPDLELGVYVLVAPEPDRQQPHEDDEVYIVLRGTACSRSRGSRLRWRKALPRSSKPAPSTVSAPTSSRAYSSSSTGALRETRS